MALTLTEIGVPSATQLENDILCLGEDIREVPTRVSSLDLHLEIQVRYVQFGVIVGLLTSFCLLS
jgi:hypothetical protein